jgi:hypothetical protein
MKRLASFLSIALLIAGVVCILFYRNDFFAQEISKAIAIFGIGFLLALLKKNEPSRKGI